MLCFLSIDLFRCDYSPDTPDSCGTTPLMDALRSGQVKIAELLINYHGVSSVVSFVLVGQSVNRFVGKTMYLSFFIVSYCNKQYCIIYHIMCTNSRDNKLKYMFTCCKNLMCWHFGCHWHQMNCGTWQWTHSHLSFTSNLCTEYPQTGPVLSHEYLLWL